MTGRLGRDVWVGTFGSGRFKMERFTTLHFVVKHILEGRFKMGHFVFMRFHGGMFQDKNMRIIVGRFVM